MGEPVTVEGDFVYPDNRVQYTDLVLDFTPDATLQTAIGKIIKLLYVDAFQFAFNERGHYVETFVAHIDNWAVWGVIASRASTICDAKWGPVPQGQRRPKIEFHLTRQKNRDVRDDSDQSKIDESVNGTDVGNQSMTYEDATNDDWETTSDP
jgi:hypothetical protein